MITKADVDALLSRAPNPASPLLSVYLDVDQSRPANLNRGFEAALKAMLRSIEQQLRDRRQLEAFRVDAQRAVAYVERYTPSARGLCLFCDDSEGFLLARELQAGVRNDARWSDTPYIRPLLEILDECERYGVVLTDRAQSRLFTVFLGEIEEHRDIFAQADVHRFKETGTDHLWSQKQFQRKAELHALWHLKRVAGMLDHLATVYGFDRLVLAGPEEAPAELRRLLPKRLRGRVVAEIALPVDAREPEVLQATLAVVQDVERAHETELVDALLNAVYQGRAVTGPDETVTRVQEGRVWHLIYAEGYTAAGGECEHCGALFSEERETCTYCGGKIRSISDLVNRLTEQVLDQGGKVEQVRDPAAARLRPAGGLGGFLRG